MKKYNTNVIVVASILFAWFGCTSEDIPNNGGIGTLPYYNDATFTPLWISPDDATLQDIHKIPDFNLTNQLGNEISAGTFENKIYVTDFFFTTCPGICPRMTANMHVIQEEFMHDDEILLLSHSVIPEFDSVPVLKIYADYHNVNPDKWHLVTGSRESIYTLGRKSYFIEEDLGFERSEHEFLHTENFVLIDKNKHIRGIYNGLSATSIDQLITDINTLKQEM